LTPYIDSQTATSSRLSLLILRDNPVPLALPPCKGICSQPYARFNFFTLAGHQPRFTPQELVADDSVAAGDLPDEL